MSPLGDLLPLQHFTFRAVLHHYVIALPIMFFESSLSRNTAHGHFVVFSRVVDMGSRPVSP